MKTDTTTDTLITTPEAAEILGITREGLRRRTLVGTPPHPVAKLRGRSGIRLYSRTEVEEMAAKKLTRATPAQ